jgi:hypothetical protein
MTKRILALIVCFSLTACYAIHVKETDEGGVIPKPSTGKAMIVLVRGSGYGLAYAFRLYDGEKLIGMLNPKNYFYYEVSPGKHAFGALFQDRGSSGFFSGSTYYFLDSSLKAGKTYYVLARPINAWGKYFVVLEPISPKGEHWGNLQGWLTNSKRSEMMEDAYAWEDKYKADIRRVRERTAIEWKTKPDKNVLRPEDGV